MSFKSRSSSVLCCVCFVSNRFGWVLRTNPLGFQTFFDFQIIFLVFWFERIPTKKKKKYSNVSAYVAFTTDVRLQLAVVFALTFLMLDLPSVLPGVIPAGGDVQITVAFTPVQYETSQITIQVVISQFNTKPYLCTVTGRSAPHLVFRYLHQRTLFPALTAPKCQNLQRQHCNLDFLWLVLLLYNILVAIYTAIAIGHHFSVNLRFMWHIFTQFSPDYELKLKSQSVHDLKCEKNNHVGWSQVPPCSFFSMFEPVPMRKSVLSITLQQHQPVHCVGVISAKS